MRTSGMLNWGINCFLLLLNEKSQFIGSNPGGNQVYKYNSSHSYFSFRMKRLF